MYSDRDIEDSSDRITLHNEQGESCITDNEVVIVPKNPLTFPVQEINGKFIFIFILISYLHFGMILSQNFKTIGFKI